MDPLRILRGIRFATRFAFRLHSDFTSTVVGSSKISRLFIEKISRERVGDEVGKILSDKRHALQGLEMVRDLGMMDLIFRVPGFDVGTVCGTACGTVCGAVKDVSTVKGTVCGTVKDKEEEKKDYISLLEGVLDDPKSKRLDDEERKIILLGSSMLSFHSLMVDVGKGKKDYYPRMICRDGLKLTNSLTNDLVKVLKGCGEWIDIMESNNDDDENRHLRLGRLIRRVGKNWTLSLYLASIYSKNSITGNQFDLEKRIRKAGLEDCYSWNHIINGDEIISIIGPNKGPRCGEMLSLIMDLQISSSNHLRKEDALAFVANSNNK